jgi:hypothetical protein
MLISDVPEKEEKEKDDETSDKKVISFN